VTAEMPSWGLAIATLNRGDDLLFCVRCALAQTLPPSEIVIVDGTADQDASRRDIAAAIERVGRPVRLIHERAERLSSGHQRNQAVRRATADILFLIDDDSSLYPDAAERIVEVYAADRERRVPGVAGLITHTLPPDPDDPGWGRVEAGAVPPAPPGGQGVLKQWVRRILDADNIVLPYDDDFPSHPIPAEVTRLHVGRRRTMAGHQMTVRREHAVAEPFDEMLERYSATEDTDMSYRLSRRGPLLTALDARIHHPAEAARGRDPYVIATVQALNPVALHRKNATDQARARRLQRQMLRRRTVIELTKDLARRDLTLPRARGFLRGLREMDRIFDMPVDELERSYPEMQRRWFDG